MDPSPPRTPTPSADGVVATEPVDPIERADLVDLPADQAAPAFDLFWAASALADATIGPFGRRADAFTPTRGQVHPLAEAAAPVPLRRHRARTDRALAARRSERSFGTDAVGLRALEGLLGALAVTDGPGDGRTWPTAGGLAAVQVHVVCRAVDGGPGGSVHRYLHDRHALARVGSVPGDDEVRRRFSVEGDLPQVLVVLGLLCDETLAKYGERGGRFALVEVGAAAQTLSLRLAVVGLHGYLLGGLLDPDVTDLVGAAGTAYRPVLALACGR
jgi:SagB-type dehydrogenase family enzyme